MTDSSSRGTHAITKDVFLEGVLGKRVGQLDYAAVRLDDPGLLDAVRRFDFVWSKVSTDEPCAVTRLVRMGFDLVVTEVQFELIVHPGFLIRDAPRADIRSATADDRDDVMRIAMEAFEKDRFHRDPQIGVKAAAAVKGAWAGNFFSGSRGDRMLVAADRCGGGTVEGFIQLLDSSPTTIIDLVAVTPSAQGRGLGAALVTAAVASGGQQVERVRVGTQIDNAASLRLYARAGFSLVSSSYVLHHHLASSEKRA
jgi:ribosomal protein S18 acetylase RimI-like enzyme